MPQKLYKTNKLAMVDKHSAPAFSMGHPPTHHKNTEQSPGPAAYDNLSTLISHKAPTLKTSGVRFKQQPSNVPGPGAYTNPTYKEHVPTALILSRSTEKNKELAPGPGKYDPNYKKVIKEHTGFKIGHSQKIADIVGQAKKLPGPGQYEINTSTIPHVNAPVMGTEKRTDRSLNNASPGPGQYHKEDKTKQYNLKSTPKIVFGKSNRSLSTSNLGPGPGAYTYADRITDGINKSKGFSMSSKPVYKMQGVDKLPGPASYNVQQLQKLQHKMVSFSVGKAQRLKIQNQQEIRSTPGPQNYANNTTNFELKNCIFGKSKRTSLANQNSLPGPGAYHAKLESTLPQFSIPKSKTGWIKPSLTPGPGTYESKMEEANTYNSIHITKDERRPFYDEKKNIPGPGTYNSPTDKHTNGFIIGNEKRGQTKHSNHPGPGNYNIPSTISNVPKYSQ